MRLDDLATCFEGIYPSAIARRSADGMPNICYLSHVAQVDDRRIAVSNRFFAKTTANIRSDPHAALLIVEPQTGRQYHLALVWQECVEYGRLFEQIKVQPHASSAQIGMMDVMRLRAMDVFLVKDISPVTDDAHAEIPVGVIEIESALRKLADPTDLSQLLSQLLDIVRASFGYEHAMVLLSDESPDTVTAAASMGYDACGVGAEVRNSIGLIGEAAGSKRSMRVNDLSRMRCKGAAVVKSSPHCNFEWCEVSLPSLSDALSQIAVPLIIHGTVQGVFFVESRERLAFDNGVTAALQTAVMPALNERLAEDAATSPPAPRESVKGGSEHVISVVYHRFDHSVFVDRNYIIKGVAGQILMYMLRCKLDRAQDDFTNREIGLSMASALPDFKDNLETRLLLLRRRLDELQTPIRLHHTGRGRLRLEMQGRPNLRLED
ncbi:GAF domain-containing protein [Rhodomicrobium vannielii]|uniref:GAF domain-containing protein n=1 Tax=Rhodomicrobium vannielii TaxID=1069 RepID=UPI000B4B29DD|nr:GAF domain-containing protein [Rhodomicrobium vannielii]